MVNDFRLHRCLVLFLRLVILLLFGYLDFHNFKDVFLAVAKHFEMSLKLLLALHSFGLLAVIYVNEDVKVTDRDIDAVSDALQKLL